MVTARFHNVATGEVIEHELRDSAPRLLNLLRSRREAINCQPDRLIRLDRVPGKSIASMHFASGVQYILWFRKS